MTTQRALTSQPIDQYGQRPPNSDRSKATTATIACNHKSKEKDLRPRKEQTKTNRRNKEATKRHPTNPMATKKETNPKRHRKGRANKGTGQESDPTPRQQRCNKPRKQKIPEKKKTKNSTRAGERTKSSSTKGKPNQIEMNTSTHTRNEQNQTQRHINPSAEKQGKRPEQRNRHWQRSLLKKEEGNDGNKEREMQPAEKARKGDPTTTPDGG
uniref:Uncharacterized protein n=1 Tax=Arundo donax TaxID=35708 RepID=A0A0A9A460_ARUDO